MDNPFDVLIGEQLSSVTFVQNYLQLDFDGNLITAYEWPIVTTLNGSFNISNNEYRNELCSIIAKKMGQAILVNNEKLELKFQVNAEIKFDLQQPRGEVIFFTGVDGQWSTL